MARRLRHEDPPQGREHFDLITGKEWQWGPDPNDLSASIPDVPRNRLKAGNEVIHSKGKWAVTNFGLELLLRPLTRYERHLQWLEDAGKHWTELDTPSTRPPPFGDDTFNIPAYELLDELRERNGPGRFYRWPIVVALELWVDVDTFAAFEDCFYAAMPVHCRAPLPVPQGFAEAVMMQIRMEKDGKRILQNRPCAADAGLLEETFRVARDIVRDRASKGL